MEATLNILRAGEIKVEPEEPQIKIFRPKPREARVTVTKTGDEYIIHEIELERLYAGSGITPGELGWQLNYQLKHMGADKLLEKAGAKTGDKIRCGDLTWEWYKPGSEK